MSDEADDETAADSQQESEQQPVDTDQSAAQSEEQPAEEGPTADQPSNADQPIEQSQDQAADSDQPADQPANSSESAASDSADDAVALAGGGGSPAAGGGGKLKVIAEFTQEGAQKFMGEDIKIVVAEWDNGQQRRFLFPIDPPERQEILKKGNVITTGVLPVTTNEVIIYPEARVRLPVSMMSYQNITGAFVFKVPDGTTLQTKFDVTVQPVDKTVKAPDADKAKGMAAPSAKQYASFDLKAEPVGDQQFRVTGKYYNGGLNSPDGRRNMSDEKQNEVSPEDSEQSDEQPVGSEPAQESEAAEQPEQHSDEESGEKPIDDSEQGTEQSGESTHVTAEQADETAKGELSAKRQSMLDLIDKWMPTSLNNPRVPEGETLDLMATAGWTKARGQQSKQEKDGGGHPVTSCGDILAAMLRLWGSNFVGAFMIRDQDAKGRTPGAKGLGYYVEADGTQSPQPGDIIVLRNGVGKASAGSVGHVGILVEAREAEWRTADGGGGALPDQTASVPTRTVRFENDIPILKSPTDLKEKQLDGWVDLDKLEQTG